MVGAENGQGSFTGRDGPGFRGIRGQDLVDELHLIAHRCDRLSDEVLGAAGSVHLRGVDEGHSGFDAVAQCCDLGSTSPRIITDVPRALSQKWKFRAIGQCRRGDHSVILVEAL